MLIINRKRGYGARRKYVHGEGFVDSLTSSLKGIGSYISQNKDLIAKPLLGAVGNLAATGLTEGTEVLMNRIVSKSARKAPVASPQLDEKAISVLQNIIGETSIPVANIIGSGIKKF
jgi:hypothetical protein